jgi:hypothetical protein
MATIRVNPLDGKPRYFYRARTTVFKGSLYVWEMGSAKGKKPIAKFPLKSLNSKKKTGIKAYEVVFNQ